MKKVVSLFTMKDSGILLVLNQEGTHWTLPGGKVEEGEGVIEALLRELKEEVPSLKVKSIKLVGSFIGKTPVSGKGMELTVFLGETEEINDVEEASYMSENLPTARWVYWRHLLSDDDFYFVSEVTLEAVKKCLKTIAKNNVEIR